MIIKCIIVEDEPSSQNILKKYISDYHDLELVAICNNAFEAMEVLKTETVDLMFLDINMPRLSGLSFLKALTNPPKVIFTTAYPEYAIDGYEVDAVDFLLKPFPFERFLKAMSKLNEKFNKNSNQESNNYLLLNADKKLHKISFSDILIIEAQGDYIKVQMRENYLMVHKTMTDIEKQLPKNQFFRIHKSYIIAYHNIEYIEGNMVKVNNKKIPMGKTYKSDFLELLKKNSK